jgi:hypothetical protein
MPKILVWTAAAISPFALAAATAASLVACDDHCTRWCKAQAGCQVEDGERSLSASLDTEIQCELSSKRTAIGDCTDECFEVIESQRERFPGDAEACVECMSGNFERSCVESVDWADCSVACDRAFVPSAYVQLSGYTQCWPEGDRPTECAPGPRRPRISVDQQVPIYRPSYSGVATVILEDPLTLALTDGSTIAVHLRDIPIPSPAVGAAMQIALRLECLWWCETEIVARDLDGALLFAAWSTSELRPPAIPELDLSYRAAPCASRREECASSFGARLLSGDVAIDPGYEAMVGSFLVINGDSKALFDVACTDIPGGVADGAVVR